MTKRECGDNDIISLSNKDWDDIGIVVSTNEDLACQDREVKPRVSSTEASLQDIGIQPIALKRAFFFLCEENPKLNKYYIRHLISNTVNSANSELNCFSPVPIEKGFSIVLTSYK